MKTFKLIITLLALLMIAGGCGGGGDDATPVVDSTAPQAESYYPDPVADGNVASADIQSNGIKVIFDEGMTSATIDSASFKVEEWNAGGTAVSGAITYDASVRTATFIPDPALASSWHYAVTITTAVTDLAGNNLDVDHTWLFTVADPPPPGAVPQISAP